MTRSLAPIVAPFLDEMIGAHPTHLSCCRSASFIELSSLLRNDNTGCRTGSHQNTCAQQTTGFAGVCHV